MRRLSRQAGGVSMCMLCTLGRANRTRAVAGVRSFGSSAFQSNALPTTLPRPSRRLPNRPQVASVHTTDFYNRISSAETRKQIPDKELKALIVERCEALMGPNTIVVPKSQQSTTKNRSKKETDEQFRDFLDVVIDELEGGYLDNAKKEMRRRSRQEKDSYARHVPNLPYFRDAYKLRRVEGIDNLLKHTFLQTVLPGVKNSTQASLMTIADFSEPQEWDTRTRAMKRVWHLHVGPTNSGKTYHALKRLEEVKNGIYAGPLRLLAHEIYEKFNGLGIPCNLITGEEQRLAHKHAQVASCTVEMINNSTPVEVCVIDEIQMIGDEERGGAWTSALMGVKAKEVHLCGEERATDLIQKLATLCGDELHIHRYKRLGPLQVEESSLCGDVSRIQPGDCYVAFSRKNLYIAKAQIEKATGMKCAIIYGGLPPEVRSQQAALFNDPDSGYDVLVASDAVGMGLNLSIKRVVFSTMTKFNGKNVVPLKHPMVRQIAGRAGRYKVTPLRGMKKGVAGDEVVAEVDDGEKIKEDEDAYIAPDHPLPQVPLPPAPSTGYVTTLMEEDLHFLKNAMDSEPEPIRSAGINATPQMIENYAYFSPPGESFSAILDDMRNRIRLQPQFHLCDMEEQITSAKLIDPIRDLTVSERIMMVAAPLGNKDSVNQQYFYYKFCEQVAMNRQFSLLDLSKLPIEELDKPPVFTMDSMKKLEDMHKITLLWLWLSYRFPYNLRPKSSAMEVKRIVEERIDKGLEYITVNTLEAIEKLKTKNSGKFPKVDKQGNAIENMVVFGKKDAFSREVRKSAKQLEREREKEAENARRMARFGDAPVIRFEKVGEGKGPKPAMDRKRLDAERAVRNVMRNSPLIRKAMEGR